MPFWRMYLMDAEKNFSSIPDEAACDCNHNRITGGPQPPINALTGEIRMCKAQRKAYTDGLHWKLEAIE